MASHLCDHGELNVIASDMISLYTELIQNLNICINLYEELETGRTWSESISDWAAGDRDNINGKRVAMRLKKLMEEMERGMDLFARLIALIQIGEMVHLPISSHNTLVVKLQQHYDPILEVVGMLKNTGIFDTEKYYPSPIHLGLVCFVNVARRGGEGVALGIGYLAYQIAKGKGMQRGVRYQLVKQLSDAVDDIEFISSLETFHTTLGAAINSIEIVLQYYKDLAPNALSYNSQPSLFGQTLPYHPPMQSEPGTEVPSSIDKMEKSIKANNLYAKQMEDTKQILETEHPEMSEEIREEMAKVTAVAACTVYLKEVCQLSEADTKRILDAIQFEI